MGAVLLFFCAFVFLFFVLLFSLFSLCVGSKREHTRVLNAVLHSDKLFLGWTSHGCLRRTGRGPSMKFVPFMSGALAQAAVTNGLTD